MLFRQQNVRSKFDKYVPKYIPTYKFIENGCLYRGAKMFDSIPVTYRLFSAEKLKNTIKAYIVNKH